MRPALLAIALLVSSPARAQNDAAAVRAAFDAIQRAVEARDVGALERLVHPEFEMQHGLGQSDTRTAWLRLVGTGRLARQTAERREYDPEIRVVGDTALIRSLVRLRHPSEGRDGWLRATAVFVRQGGRWMQLNQQSTPLYDGPVAELGGAAALAGAYDIPGREGFSLEPRDGYLALRWANGAVLPLVPSGPDRFAAGVGSTVAFGRGTDGAVRATRTGTDGKMWWTATRRAH